MAGSACTSETKNTHGLLVHLIAPVGPKALQNYQAGFLHRFVKPKDNKIRILSFPSGFWPLVAGSLAGVAAFPGGVGQEV